MGKHVVKASALPVHLTVPEQYVERLMDAAAYVSQGAVLMVKRAIQASVVRLNVPG